MEQHRKPVCDRIAEILVKNKNCRANSRPSFLYISPFAPTTCGCEPSTASAPASINVCAASTLERRRAGAVLDTPVRHDDHHPPRRVLLCDLLRDIRDGRAAELIKTYKRKVDSSRIGARDRLVARHPAEVAHACRREELARRGQSPLRRNYIYDCCPDSLCTRRGAQEAPQSSSQR